MAKRGARKAGKKGISKAAAIREYAQSNPTAKPKVIAEALASQGYDLTAQYVSMILSNDRRKAGETRPRKAKVATAMSAPKARRASSGGALSVDDLRVAKSFVAQVGSLAAAREAVEALAEFSSSSK